MNIKSSARIGSTWLLLLGVICAVSVGAQEGLSPHQTVEQASDQLLAVIQKTKALDTMDDSIFFAEVTTVLDPFVDFTAIARSVMAVHYKRASDEQREKFSTAFKGGLVRAYSKALLTFGDGGINVLAPVSPPRNPRRPTVKMEIISEAGKIYPVSYSMAQSDDGFWKMRNVIINGLNIGLTFRNQFSASMKAKKNDLDAVITGWSKLVESEAVRSSENN